MIRSVSPNDAKQIAAIYNHYIANSHATFELDHISEESMRKKISIHQYPWLVHQESGEMLGFAYASQWKPRPAYRHTMETTIYLDQSAFWKGVGPALYRALLEELEEMGCQSAIASIALPNEGSVLLHERLGFKRVGQMERVGFKFNQWIDVEYWQKML